ncbi:MAG: cysteine hydrolase [Pseudomonadota bacterium]|nr:cysteine hydrolase [Pseudomonadota bacterium]
MARLHYAWTMRSYPFPDALVEQIVDRRGTLHCYDRIHATRTALVVVDMQNGFLDPRWPTALPAARDIVPAINRLASALRASGGEVVWVSWCLDPAADVQWRVFFDHVLGAKAGERFRTIFGAGHEGQALWPELDYKTGEMMVGKTNFSGFSGSGGLLEAHLRAQRRDTVLVAGTVTNVCCESTARDAAFANFKTIMVADANAGRSDTDNLVAFSTFIRGFGDVMTVDEIIARLGVERAA